MIQASPNHRSQSVTTLTCRSCWQAPPTYPFHSDAIVKERSRSSPTWGGWLSLSRLVPCGGGRNF